MPRCKECKELFEKRYPFQKYCMDKDECITAHWKAAKDKEEKRQRKEWNKKKKERRHITHSGEMKKELARLCQKLARMIDERHGYEVCIDCQNPFTSIIDGGHYHSKGSNASLKYNLHNIHSQRRHCNGFQGGKHKEYYEGLVLRYGQEYADYIDKGLVKDYKYIGLKNKELPEKLKTVRAIIRNFESYKFKDAIHEREMFNKLLNIYT